MPPSSGGLTVIQMPKMIERFPIGDSSQGFGFGSTKTLSVMADTMRLALADRSVRMGDSDFVPMPMKGLVHPTDTGTRSATIVPGVRLQPNPTPGDPRPFDVAGTKASPMPAVAEPVTGPGETTPHFVAVDKHGNMVTCTATVESSHRIGVFAGYRNADGSLRNLGVLSSNEPTDFSTSPSTHPHTGPPATTTCKPTSVRAAARRRR